DHGARAPHVPERVHLPADGLCLRHRPRHARVPAGLHRDPEPGGPNRTVRPRRTPDMTASTEIIAADVAEPTRAARLWVRFGAFAWRALLFLILFLTFFPFIFMVITSLKDTHQFY